ncbi:MAG: helix-hairpin-helix domain-containing protein [Actinomycetota bacterium]
MPPDIVVKKDLRERLSELAGTRRDVWVVAGLAAALVVGGIALFGRSATAVIAPPAIPAAETTGPGDAATAGLLAVHVAGAVRKPGLYELADGRRVADAIAAAGGPTRRADLDALNLAEPLADGVQVFVARRGETAGAAASPIPGASPGAPAAVDINSADVVALEQIPGIGPVKAQAIVEYRTQIGSFESIDQLLEVTGIGPATLESMRPYVTL